MVSKQELLDFFTYKSAKRIFDIPQTNLLPSSLITCTQ